MRMSSALIVNLPFALRRCDLWRLIAEYVPQSIRALRAAPPGSQIDCLPNDPAAVVFKLAPSGSECEVHNCVTSNETKEMLQREHGAVGRVVSL